MKKSADAFRSIGEVSRLVGVPPHVLRYWETQFPLLSPVKRQDGRRYYRPDDVRLAAGLCEVLREEGLTIRGAKKQMTEDRGAALRERGMARLVEALPAAPRARTKTPAPRPQPAPQDWLGRLRQLTQELRDWNRSQPLPDGVADIHHRLTKSLALNLGNK